MGSSSSSSVRVNKIDKLLDEEILDISRKGIVQEVKLLIDSGADPNVKDKDKDNCTSLHRASSNGHPDVVEHLVNRGGDPNAMSSYVNTPLYLASRKGHHDVVEILSIYTG